MNPETSVEKVKIIMNLSSCEISHSEKTQTLKVEDAEGFKKDEEGSLGPATPVPARRNGEAVIGSVTPLTWVSSPLKVVTCNSDEAETSGLDSSVQTPKGCVFDPFAPGPDELMLAPRKKSMEDPRTRAVRRLDFQDSDVSMEVVGENNVEVVAHEESFLESVYESLLNVIVSKQTEGDLAENPAINLDCGGFKTPVSSPLLKGVAETCPGAPMKRASESRKYDPAICRKLEF